MTIPVLFHNNPCSGKIFYLGKGIGFVTVTLCLDPHGGEVGTGLILNMLGCVYHARFILRNEGAGVAWCLLHPTVGLFEIFKQQFVRRLR